MWPFMCFSFDKHNIYTLYFVSESTLLSASLPHVVHARSASIPPYGGRAAPYHTIFTYLCKPVYFLVSQNKRAQSASVPPTGGCTFVSELLGKAYLDLKKNSSQTTNIN